jgi:hypothetical protein
MSTSYIRHAPIFTAVYTPFVFFNGGWRTVNVVVAKFDGTENVAIGIQTSTRKACAVVLRAILGETGNMWTTDGLIFSVGWWFHISSGMACYSPEALCEVMTSRAISGRFNVVKPSSALP